jgi:Family of unknown function (DUF5696)
MKLSNSQIAVEINEKSGYLTVAYLESKGSWESAKFPVECEIWEVSTERKRELLPEQWDVSPISKDSRTGLRFSAAQFGIAFSTYYYLKENELTIDIPFEEIEESSNDCILLNLSPLKQMGRVNNGENGYMLIPSHSGIICRFDKTETRQHESRVYMEQSQWEDFTCMPVFGATHDNIAFVGICSSGEYDASIISETCSGSGKTNSSYPRFNYRYSKIDEPDKINRQVKYCFLNDADANYCGMAKIYRKYLINERNIVPLKQRVPNNSALKYYVESYNEIRLAVGGNKKRKADGTGEYVPVGTIPEAEIIIKSMHETGIEKALVMFEYWTFEGGDGAYPTKLPVDPRLGSNEDLSNLLKTNTELGYRSTNWDNYTDCYRVSPEWDEKYIMRDRDGWLRRGGVWNGGQAYLACPSLMTDFAKRDLQAQRALGFDGLWYIDAMVQPPRICYDKSHGHPQNRRTYVEGLKKIARMTSEVFGGCSIENSNDSMADCIDGIAQVCAVNDRFMTTELGKYFADEFVPFYQIAFHGLQVYHVCSLMHMPSSFGSVEIGVLKDIEFGAAPRADISFGEIQEGRGYKNWLHWMKKQYDWHYKITKPLLYEFIENHEEIKPGIFKTEYSSGLKIIVDYNVQKAEYHDHDGNVSTFTP